MVISSHNNFSERSISDTKVDTKDDLKSKLRNAIPQVPFLTINMTPNELSDFWNQVNNENMDTAETLNG